MLVLSANVDLGPYKLPKMNLFEEIVNSIKLL